MPFEPIAKPEEPPEDAQRRRQRAKRLLPDLMRLLRRRRGLDLDALADRVLLPSLPVTDEEIARITHRARGQSLARQDRWEDLSDQIDHADATRLHTPGGEMAASLLACGARADVVAAATDALHDGAEPDADGLESLEDALSTNRCSHACAMVAALAHVDIGLAWRATATDENRPRHELRFLEHFDRAADLLAPFDAVDLDAPSLAMAQCALLEARPQPGQRLAEDYGRLIGLDPDSPRHMRAFGEALLPRHFGSYVMLEHEARRTAGRTSDVWGTGGYVWTYLGALTLDAGALAAVDADAFIEGLRDIVARRDDQHVINRLAAFCGIVMAPRRGKPGLPAAEEAARERIHGCLDWLIERHLHELHPLIWSQTLLNPGLASALPQRHALVSKGRDIALRVIAECFADDIARGGAIAFSKTGMYRLPAI